MNNPPEWRKECDTCEGEGKAEHPHMSLHDLRSEAPEYAVVNCEDCDGAGWNWTDEPVSLAECRPGPFWFDGSLGFKTEYGASVGKDIGGGKVEWTVTNWPDAYCMDSGETFWGGATTHEARAELLVWPVEQLIIAPASAIPTGTAETLAAPFMGSAVPSGRRPDDDTTVRARALEEAAKIVETAQVCVSPGIQPKGLGAARKIIASAIRALAGKESS